MAIPFQRSKRIDVARYVVGFTLAIALVVLPAESPGQTHIWSQRFGGTDFDEGRGIAVDDGGGVLVAGWFSDRVDFGGGLERSAGLRDIFVAKYDPAGNHVWSQVFGDTGYDEAWAVAVDGAGNVVVTGLFGGEVDFGDGPLVSAGEDDIFVVKIDPEGNTIWSHRFGDTGDDAGFDIAVDPDGNVLVTGLFEGRVNFGGEPHESEGFADIFLSKYDIEGNYIWSRSFGDTEVDEGAGVAVDELGNVFTTGYFRGTVDFGGGPLSSAAGYADMFLAKYDAAGNHIWSDRFGDVDFDAGEAVAVDGTGSVVVTGRFSGTVDFGGGPLTSAGSSDIVVARFGPWGSHVWSQRCGNVDNETGFGIAVDGADDVLVTGYFRGTVDFGGGPLTSAGARDIFMAKYGPGGNHVWSQRFGNSFHDGGYDIAVDVFGNAHLTGFFGSTVDFGGDPLTSAGGEDIFVAKYTPNVLTGIGDGATANFHLWQNRPNPFNPATRIEFSLEEAAHVTLSVYDITGRLVTNLVDRRMGEGTHIEQWDGRNYRGEAVASGIYFYRLSAGTETLTRKAVLLR